MSALIQARCPLNNLLATLSSLLPLVTQMQHSWMVPLFPYASAATILPLDLDMWHRRLAHHHLEGVKKLVKKHFITGMTLD